MLLSALFAKGKRMYHDPQSAPDVTFLRNIAITLLALTVVVGAIGVTGSLVTSDPFVLDQSLDGNTTARDTGIPNVDSLGL